MLAKKTRRTGRQVLRPTFGASACLLLVCAVAACGDDSSSNPTDGQGGGGGKPSTGSGGSGGNPTTSSSSSAGGAGGEAGGGTGGQGGGGGGAGGAGGEGGAGDAPWSAGFAGVVALDETAEDRLWAVAFDAQSRVYGAGFITRSGDSHMAVARFDTSGVLDTSFGTNGVATVNVVAGGAVETARGILLQSDGKVVIAGNVEHDPSATPPDADIAVVRFNADGTLDTGFGTNGVAIHDLGTGDGTTSDMLWGIDRDAQDRLVLFGGKKADARADRDRVVVRLSANGALDSSFATGGVFTLDVDGLNLGDNPRNGFVEPDGKILFSGYTNVGGRNQVVLLRLNPDGTPDTTFSSDGVVRLAPFPLGMAEAYGAARQSDGRYVTTGYGRSEESGPVDLVSFRVTPTGGFDTSWGVAGGVVLDVAGDNDRGRNVAVLPDDRVFMAGSATPATGNVDAMVALLKPDGALDTSLDPAGYRLLSFDRPDEAFFGVAVSPDGAWVAATGYRSDGMGPEDDDALLLVLPVADRGQ
jgi:uncharacterized delta-60 repeat protein